MTSPKGAPFNPLDPLKHTGLSAGMKAMGGKQIGVDYDHLNQQYSQHMQQQLKPQETGPQDDAESSPEDEADF